MLAYYSSFFFVLRKPLALKVAKANWPDIVELFYLSGPKHTYPSRVMNVCLFYRSSWVLNPLSNCSRTLHQCVMNVQEHICVQKYHSTYRHIPHKQDTDISNVPACPVQYGAPMVRGQSIKALHLNYPFHLLIIIYWAFKVTWNKTAWPDTRCWASCLGKTTELSLFRAFPGETKTENHLWQS